MSMRPDRWIPAAVTALALLAADVAPASAQSQWDGLLHGSAISYQDSGVKDGAYSAGFYGTYGTGWKHLVEVGATRTGIDYLDGSTLHQTDVTAAYSRFGARASGRVGVHFIATSDSLTDRGLVVFGGASLYEVGEWSAGAEVALSRYPAYDDGLVVSQLAPSIGLTAYSTGSLVVGVTLRGYGIRLSEDVGLGDTDYLSAEGALSVTAGPVTLSGYAWGGEQAFAVRTGGFTAFNLAELHTGGYGGGIRWVMTPRSALSAGLYLERFQDLGSVDEARSRIVSVSLGFTL